MNKLIPAQTALLAMDFQAGIVSRVPDADALLQRTAAAIAKVRRAGGHVGYVRVAFDEADVEALPARNKMSAHVTAAGHALRSDAPETQIDERIAPQAGDIVVRKTRVGPFSTTDLDRRLRERGVTTLVLSGIATSGVVLSTVREAADMDYELFVLSDATADFDPDVHRILIERIFPRQGTVLTSEELEY